MMENGFLYVCINIYVYLFIFSYPKLCFSYSGIKKEAEGSLFVLVVFFFSFQISEQLRWMERENLVCYLGIRTHMTPKLGAREDLSLLAVCFHALGFNKN